MNSEFELIRYNENLPARIELRQGNINTPYHWHKEIELVEYETAYPIGEAA